MKRSRSLCEVPNFLRAVREARETHPDLPRAAWIAAGRAPVRALQHVDAQLVVAHALRAVLPTGRSAA